MVHSAHVRFQGVSPYLYYEDASAALAWLARTFGFIERSRYVDAYGVVQEAEMTAGDTVIMLTGVGSGYWESKQVPGPVGQMCVVYVDDVDAHWTRARDAGVDTPAPQDRPYGARVYTVDDLGGHSWAFWQLTGEPVSVPDGWRQIHAGAPEAGA